MLQKVMSQFCVEKFLSESAETFRRLNLSSFISFGYRKYLCFRGLCHDFPSKKFRLTVPKHFVEDPFSLSLDSGIENVYASARYVTIFRRKFFVSRY